MHPRGLRCSSLKYSRYSRSSRLARGAPRPPRCDARLSPRAAGLRSSPVTNERWQRVKALFQAAVERPAAERDAFLAAATGDDDALRREVESLLASDAGG